MAIELFSSNMKIAGLLAPIAVFLLFATTVPGQAMLVINAPGQRFSKQELSSAEKRAFDLFVLPGVRKKLTSEFCEEELNVAAVLRGSFTRPRAVQTLVFYQFCQSGNGLGSAGVTVFENGTVVRNYVSAESGWTIDAKTLPDINRNGLDEAALYYSGGMHQGIGGTGVDIIEFSSGGLKGIGWFQAEGFNERSEWDFKVSVKPGRVPVFFQERWTSAGRGKYRRTGKPALLRLKPVVGSFELIR
jgi:hypothetical protein